jgi:hypothetical protein
MKKVLFVIGCLLLLNFSSINVFAQTPPIIERQFSDDSYVHVPLQFGFPFYGQVFTDSFMHSNGVVSFMDPRTNAGPGNWAYCCEGIQASQLTPQFNYMIAPLWTDLYPVGQSRFRTQGDSTYQRYHWENIAEISNMNNLNTFGLEIRPSGFIGAYYERINIQNQNVFAGTIGNVSLGEHNQIYYGRGIPGQSLQNWSMPETYGTDPCLTNPLSSATCPGYATAYLAQQCSYSALYNSSCPGYQTAYFTQQCNANQLYSQSCPGYASAYLDQQCSLNALYSTTCSGYQQAYFSQQCSLNGLYSSSCPNYADAYYVQQCSINPLYDTGCTGYQQAYFDQQCSLNSLYNSSCPGYQTAYFNQQCSLNPLYNTQCPGYQTAYKTQQCTANALYATDCPGYQTAYFNQQCSISGLYSTSCPNYATAYFSQQCSLDGLYNTQCPNYADAYATKLALDTSKAVSDPVSSTPTSTATVIDAPTVDSSGEIKVAVVADSNVNAVITSTATSASPATAATTTVPLVSAPAPQTTTAPVASAREEKKEEKKETATAETSSSSTTTASSSDDKKEDKPKTNRQELQERRQAAARANAIESGKNLANSMGNATSMEQQAAVQNVVIQAMGFTPGFDAYGKANITDVAGYKPYTIYNNQRNVDNRFAGVRLFGATDRIHNDMVNLQYRER